jgi:hypothetical protein
MPRVYIIPVLACASAAGIALALTRTCSAQTVWSGLTFTFTKANGTDALLPENQDRITSNVWITRSQFGMGLLNAKTECDEIQGCTYTHNLSPGDTAWATARMAANSTETIAAANWQNLAFTSWEAAYGGQVGLYILNPSYRDAVVHLLSDDIYLDLRFTGWTAQGGGGFAYQRATASSPPTPSGDYNNNGVVDPADYVVWRDTLNQSAAPQGSGADGNANGTIDAGDYSYWRERFGNIVVGSGAGAVAPVPEPAAVVLLLTGLLLVRRSRARRVAANPGPRRGPSARRVRAGRLGTSEWKPRRTGKRDEPRASKLPCGGGFFCFGLE